MVVLVVNATSIFTVFTKKYLNIAFVVDMIFAGLVSNYVRLLKTHLRLQTGAIDFSVVESESKGNQSKAEEI